MVQQKQLLLDWSKACFLFSGVGRRVGKRGRDQNAVCLESRVRNLDFAFCLKRFNNSDEHYIVADLVSFLACCELVSRRKNVSVPSHRIISMFLSLCSVLCCFSGDLG